MLSFHELASFDVIAPVLDALGDVPLLPRFHISAPNFGLDSFPFGLELHSCLLQSEKPL